MSPTPNRASTKQSQVAHRGALVFQTERLQLPSYSLQLFFHSPGVRGHFLTPPHQEGPDPVARLQQEPGGGNAVSAVVSRAAEGGDARSGIGVFRLHNGSQLLDLPLLLRGRFSLPRGQKAK